MELTHNDIGSGSVFSRLAVIKYPVEGSTRRALCRCKCGNNVVVYASCLLKGKVKSCGCLWRDGTTKVKARHNQCGTRLYHIWKGMKRRCLNKNDEFYFRYGGRGIRVCDDWLVFEPFYNWAIANGYNDDLQIDRIDNNGDYAPENCRWTTRSENVINTRNRRNESGYRGVQRNGKKWQVNIQYQKKFHYLGTFACPTVAALARDRFIIKHDLPHKTAILRKAVA